MGLEKIFGNLQSNLVPSPPSWKYNFSNSAKKLKKNTLLHSFFIRNSFISNARLKLAKNQANAKQHPEAELVLLENHPYSSSMLSTKIMVVILNNNQKKKYVCKNEDGNEK